MLDALVAAAAGLIAGSLVTLAVGRFRSARAPYAAPARPAALDPYEDGRTQRVLAAFPFAAFLIDSGGIVRYVNAAAEELFEIHAERAIGQALIAVVPSVAMERQVLAAIGGETSMNDITIGDFARERTLGITAHPFEGGAVAVAADRTALLAIEHVRREFVANVSHELRTPLSAIKLMLETVLLSDDDAEARTLFLPQVAREVDRMIRLVEDLLELARSESGNLLLRREIFDLTDVATSVVNTFSQRSTTLGIELDLGCAGGSLRRGRPQPPHASGAQLARQRITAHPDRAERLRSRLQARGETRCCACAIRDAASPITICRTSSSDFTSSTARVRANTPAPASASRSPGTSSKPTAARSPRTRFTGADRPSFAACRGSLDEKD